VLVARDVVPRLGGLAGIRAEGAFRRCGDGPASGFEAIIEDTALAPLLRGADLAAWKFEVRRHLVRSADANGKRLPGCPRLARYLDRHSARLVRPGCSAARLPARPDKHRIAWHDLAGSLRAAALPSDVRTPFGIRPLLLLNTVYFAETSGEIEAFRLAACLNSMPVRVFAATIAERAKDAHFRFFAWTVSMLPIPSALATSVESRRIETISRRAHADGLIRPAAAEELDGIVGRAFGLTSAETGALARFDDWLHGRPHS
jgi:hypothetical protein